MNIIYQDPPTGHHLRRFSLLDPSPFRRPVSRRVLETCFSSSHGKKHRVCGLVDEHMRDSRGSRALDPILHDQIRLGEVKAGKQSDAISKEHPEAFFSSELDVIHH